MARTLLSVQAVVAGFWSGGQFVETMVEYCGRLGWVASDGVQVTITPLGSALVRALTVAPDGEVDELVLDRDDPLALARVVGRIAALGPAMVVDPYLRVDQLLVLVGTQVTRLLVRAGNATDLAALKATLGAVPVDRTIELRAVPASALHDRLVIPIEGDVWMLGSSLNGVGRHLTTLVRLHDAAGQLRSAYEETWRSADPITIATPLSPT